MPTDRKEYMKKYRESHREELNARSKAWHQAHKEEVNARSKAYYEAHKEELLSKQKQYNEAHKEEVNARSKAWNQSHKKEKTAYRKSDKNSDGRPKDYIRQSSRSYLHKTLKFQKIENYERHHCFGYETEKEFIYIPRWLHKSVIHPFLRDNNIDADTNHFEQIKHLLDSCKEKIFIIKDGEITEYN